jgi:HAD superfamily 5'-nucleotidase-like hydrolase
MSVFINRSINMKKIKAIGFDMDHTLVQYNTEAFEGLTHQASLQKLVDEKNYPKEITKLEFEFTRAIQGLVIDKKRGNILKVSRYNKVKEAYHGLEKIPFRNMQEIYRNRVVDLSSENYQSMDTGFSISYTVLYGQLVQLKNEGVDLPSYQIICDDVKEMIDLAHNDGTLKNVVAREIDKYIEKDQNVVRLLEVYKEFGKKLLLITNADYKYTCLLMDYAIKPLLENHECWRDLFDLVITSARKPNFFTQRNDFLTIHQDSGLMSNHQGTVESGVFQGGWAGKIQDDLDLEGDEILYLGDHIYGDVVSIKKTFNWRTALVFDPLKDEVESIQASRQTQTKIDLLMNEKEKLERQLNQLEMERFQTGKKLDRPKVNGIYAEIERINTTISEDIKDYRRHFNPFWGEMMRAGQEESRFADQMEKYACLYMAKVSDLLSYGPKTYFRPHKRILPHEAGSTN